MIARYQHYGVFLVRATTYMGNVEVPHELDLGDREVAADRGTTTCVLAVIEHGTRRIRVLGATEDPVQSWVVQQAWNLLMDLDDTGDEREVRPA